MESEARKKLALENHSRTQAANTRLAGQAAETALPGGVVVNDNEMFDKEEDDGARRSPIDETTT